MRYDTRYRSYLYSDSLPRGVKWLIITNVALFLLYYLGGAAVRENLRTVFALVPSLAIKHLFVWQLATYMFLHGGIEHILFNMLFLWMLGTPLEQDWGTRRFLKYYFLCGI